MQKDTLETFNAFCKNQKITSLLSENQTILLLRLVTDILYHSDAQFIKEHFQTLKELIDPLLPYVRDPAHS